MLRFSHLMNLTLLFTREEPIRTKPIVLLSAVALAVAAGVYFLFFHSSAPPAPLEMEYVTSPSLEVLNTPAVVHKVLAILKYGDRAAILKKEGTWAKVQVGKGIAGWVDTRELTPARIYEGGQKLLQGLGNSQVQATGLVELATNVHLEPKRGAAKLGMLTQGQIVDVYNRRMVPRSSTPANATLTEQDADAWYLVKSGQRAGWILGRRITLNIPQAISQYAANYNTVAWFVLDTVQDGDNRVPQYLVADREGSVVYDFTHIRVFTWSLRGHHYVTSFVKSGLKGDFPIQVEQRNGIPYFRLRLLGPKGNKFQSVYALYNTIVRPAGKVEGWTSDAMPQPGRR